ncbi:MAG: tetratricopeptide repeat protein, partial [Rhodothermales bacterium]|nr:tetratricopeptide repeat protein [Rhodothermales bacterium]
MLRLAVLALAFVVLCSGGTALAQPAPDRAADAFAGAYKRYTDRLYEQAIDEFDAFRRAYPEHPSAVEALYYQAAASLAAGHAEQAVALFRDFQQRHPAHPLAFPARLALGQYFYENGEAERAITTLEQVLEEGPPAEVAAKALFWMGEAAGQLGRTDDALRYYQQAAEGYRFTETAPIALYAIAYTHVEQDDLDAAARAFERLGARYPDSPYARNIGLALAEIYYELQDFGRAVAEILQRLPQLDAAAREQAQFLLAESYNQLRDSENAILYYRRFTEGDPESLYYRPALYGLGWNYYHEGAHQWAAEQFALAREGYDDELALRATYYEAVNRALADQKRVARDLYGTVADQWPEAYLADHALYERGLLQYELREWQAAHDTFSRLL